MSSTISSETWLTPSAPLNNATRDTGPTNYVARGWALTLFNIFSILNICCGFLACIVQLTVVIFELVNLFSSELLTSPCFYLQFYTIVFTIGVVFTEMEWTETIRNIDLLQSWIYRGLFYIFVGLLCFISGIIVGRDVSMNIICLIDSSGFLMMGCGSIYSVMVSLYAIRAIFIQQRKI
jgi:hypothetical protein